MSSVNTIQPSPPQAPGGQARGRIAVRMLAATATTSVVSAQAQTLTGGYSFVHMIVNCVQLTTSALTLAMVAVVFRKPLRRLLRRAGRVFTRVEYRRIDYQVQHHHHYYPAPVNRSYGSNAQHRAGSSPRPRHRRDTDTES